MAPDTELKPLSHNCYDKIIDQRYAGVNGTVAVVIILLRTLTSSITLGAKFAGGAIFMPSSYQKIIGPCL